MTKKKTTKEEKFALVKNMYGNANPILGNTSWTAADGVAYSKGIASGVTTLADILTLWSAQATTPVGTLPTPNTGEPEATVELIASTGAIPAASYLVPATVISTILEASLGYDPDDVDVNADGARTAILNATRSMAEINFRRASRDLAFASIYGASRGTVAKYGALLDQMGKEIESGIVAGEHEYVQAKIAEAQVKANIVGGKLPARATVITGVNGDNMRGRISDSDHTQEKYVRNAAMTTEVSISNSDQASKIRMSYNNFLASVYGTQVQGPGGLGSILASAVSQMGEPGISWVYIA